ncbi:MAG: CCA tRNA nucleotidyltransferase [Deltaproteobacteria bacterium]|nr:CCA tRNA nucleotidyltransferase [Deltaproteobacteria bacterium]
MKDPLLEGARLVAKKLREHGFEAYFAGGCVRDTLRGYPPKDYDVATDARPEQVQSIFRRTLAVGAQFGVVLVRLPGKLEYEVATYRADGPYADGRRPTEVAYSTTKEDDVARRDFTINALLMDPESLDIIDVVGGRQDLEDRIIRAVGDAERRFAEDRLRMLRAVRFAASLGFEIEPTTLSGIRAHAHAISVVSKERIVSELLAMWNGPAPGRAIRLLDATGLFDALFPFASTERTALASWFDALPNARQGLAEGSVPIIGFSLLLEGTSANVEAVLRELKLPRDTIRGVMRVHSIRELLLTRQGSEVDLLRPLISSDWPRDRAYLMARSGAEAVAPWDEARRALDEHPLPELPILSGQDLIGLGLAPGPRFKEILMAAEEAVLLREITTREQALEMAKRMLSPSPAL